MNLKINLYVQVLFVIFVGTFENVSCKSTADLMERNGQALFLTPLLEWGFDLADIRARAKVTLNQLSNIESYAGFFTVHESTDANLFFWYFPAKVNPEKAPVVLYLEGALHKDMFFGIFEQNGPIAIRSDGTLVERKESWNNKHHIVYMDSSFNMGYSYSNRTKPAGFEEMTWYVNSAVEQFFKLFQSLKRREFFIVGSYNAGKLALGVSKMIDSVAIRNPNLQINLKGLAIANGLIDPIKQFNFGTYLYEVGLIDDNGQSQFHQIENQISGLERGHVGAYHDLESLIIGKNSIFNNLTEYAHPFNILKDAPMPVNTQLSIRIQSRALCRELNIGDTPYNHLNAGALDYLSHEMTRSGSSQLQEVLELSKQYRVLIYTGNLDILCSYPSVHDLLLTLNWGGLEEFKNADRILWRVRNGDLAGYKTKARNLIEVLVRNAGHFTSIDQPQWTLELLESFTDGSL